MRGIISSLSVTLTCSLSVSNAAAQSLEKDVGALVDKVSPQVIAIRQEIHKNPELSNREVRTAELVAKQLRALGLQVKTGIARTGVVGVLQGKGPGPVIAVRADMDALPVTEAGDLPFKSTARATYLDHTPTFYADDKAVPIAIRALSTLVLDYLASGKR